MNRLLLLVTLSFLTACATLAPQSGNKLESNAIPSNGPDGVGRIGPDGGPLIADRGIGGTGAPVPGALVLRESAPGESAPGESAPGQSAPGQSAPGQSAPLGITTPGSTVQTAERGIGGTGGPMTSDSVTASSSQIADRGIGGTGVVGVVTGFGSIFVNGLEIQYDNKVAVDIDGTPSPVAALRIGQLVALRAHGPTDAPFATAISVRSEVIGRIEGVELGSGMLTIAGQTVSVADGTWGSDQFGLGDWVKVSGLRRHDGTVVASRLDSAPAGMLSVHGQAVSDGGAMRVGRMMLGAAAANNVQHGQFVIVSGDYAGGRLQASTVAPDTLSASPANYFGPATNRLIVQAFVHVGNGTVSMNGTKIRSAPAVTAGSGHDAIAVVSLHRDSDGSYVASDLRYAGYRNQPGRTPLGGGRAGRGDGSQHTGHAPVTSAASDPADSGSVPGGGGASAAGEIGPVNPVATATAAPVIVTKSVSISPASVMKQATTPAAVANTPAVTSGQIAAPVANLPAATSGHIALPIRSTAAIMPATIVTPIFAAPAVTPVPILTPGSTPPTSLPSAPAVTPVPATPLPVLQSIPPVVPMAAIPSDHAALGIRFGAAHVGSRSKNPSAPWWVGDTGRAGNTAPGGGRGDRDAGSTHISAVARTHDHALRPMGERSRILGAGGSAAGQTIQLLTGAVASAMPVRPPHAGAERTPAGNVTINGTITAPGRLSVARGDGGGARIGTASGNAAAGRGDRSRGH